MDPYMPPSSEEVREWLKPLSEKQVEALARLSSMSFSTLTKIRRGLTKNPGIDTVRKFVPFIKASRLT